VSWKVPRLQRFAII